MLPPPCETVDAVGEEPKPAKTWLLVVVAVAVAVAVAEPDADVEVALAVLFFGGSSAPQG
jgi:hypothetical protein